MRISFFYVFTCPSFYGEFIVVVCKFNEMYGEIWGRRERWVVSGWFASNT